MARFNQSTTAGQRLRKDPTATKNHEGGLAFTPTPELELYLRACTSLLEDKFYTKGSKERKDIQALLGKVDRKYVLQLAAYVRNEMKLRSLPVMLLAEAARMPSKELQAQVVELVGAYKSDPSLENFNALVEFMTNHEHSNGVLSKLRTSAPEDTSKNLPLIKKYVQWLNDGREPKKDVKQYAPKIIQRADEPAEALAYWTSVFGSKAKLPNALKKGLAEALSKFDEYQLAKWDKGGRDMKLRDVIRLVHPRPNDQERAALYKRAIEGELKTPETWEVKISGGGSTSENWGEIAPKMGTMALLRNLRNFEQKGAQKALAEAKRRFRDPEAVQKSRLLPFRWYTALKHVSNSDVADAVREAMELSVVNLPKWRGSTAIFSDNSGSMHSQLSSKSTVQYIEIAGVMSALALHMTQDEYLIGAFGQTYKDVSLSRRDSVLTNAGRVANAHVGHSTNAYLAIQSIRKRKKKFDRIFIFSDMQCYDTSGGSWYSDQSLAEEWKKYRQEVNSKAMLYSVDLAGYGSLQWPENDRSVYFLAGWSEKVLDLVEAIENQHSAVDLIKERW